MRWRAGEGLVFDAGAPGRPTVLVDGDGTVATSPVEMLLVAAATCSPRPGSPRGLPCRYAPKPHEPRRSLPGRPWSSRTAASGVRRWEWRGAPVVRDGSPSGPRAAATSAPWASASGRARSSCSAPGSAAASGRTADWGWRLWARTEPGARATSRRCSASTRGRVPARGGTRSWDWAAACSSPWGGASGASPPGGLTKKKGARRGTPGDPARSATLDARAHGRVPPHHGPAVALAQHAQLGQLLLVQPIVALGEVQHRVVEPFLLVLGSGFQDAAAQDVRTQLVAGLFEGRGRGHLARLRTLLGHAWGAPLFSLDWERGDTGGGSGRSKPPMNRRRHVIGRFATRNG